MDRITHSNLLEWAARKPPQRKPLIIRGARQVGKTHAVRKLGEERFASFVEINFERTKEAKKIFEAGLSAAKIIDDLFLFSGKKIVPSETLLFFDEIQEAPQAITALRYLFEEIPELHVIAAGSLLDFALEQIGVPVGRVDFLYMCPMSFLEFLNATNNNVLAQEILHHKAEEQLNEAIHNKLLILLGDYMAVGGMPEAVKTWIDSENLSLQQRLVACNRVHLQLVEAYRQDFQKYAKNFQLKYLELLFNNLPSQISKPITSYSKIVSEYRKRELQPCLDLLVKAGIVHQITHSGGNGIPLASEADFEKFKVILLDVALTQTILGVQPKDWLLNPEQTFINRGEIVEAFVGQELLAYHSYSEPSTRPKLYYWLKQQEKKESTGNAEIDYLIQLGGKIVPVEVKSKDGRSLKSMRTFLQSKPNSPYGIKFSTGNYCLVDNMKFYPLYAVAGALDLLKSYE